VVTAVLLVWAGVGTATGFPHWWELTLYSTTSSVTVIMLFAIQHTQHREQLVTQRKLDELVLAQPQADNHLIGAESASDDELAELELHPGRIQGNQ
jgi:low affinity Fe/Cu permease